MKISAAQLRKIIKEEIESSISEAPRGMRRGAGDKFWQVAPELEQTLKTKLAPLASKPNLGDEAYRNQLLLACEEVISKLNEIL
jgi:hypothetical protein